MSYTPVCEQDADKVDGVPCDRLPVTGFCALVKEVVVIASSSRGGSSIFTEILRQSPDLLHFAGEINPLLAIAGLTYPMSGRADDSLSASDAGTDNAPKLALLERQMAFAAGVNRPVDLGNPSVLARFTEELIWRVTVQWPEVEVDPDFVASSAAETLAELVLRYGWQRHTFGDPQLFHILFLTRLRSRYQAINPHYYDLNPELIGRYCPEAAICQAPPGQNLIEEPPFVLITPRQPATAELLGRLPLVIKTPSNAYRLDFLRAIFPHARLRVLHLVRNPADSINGLVDGWLYHGFFSHRLAEPLAIAGYSDRFPDWGRQWWKYDLPPGWQGWTEMPLEYVCGQQWRQAHQAVLDFLAQGGTDSLRVAFEDVLGPPASRQRSFAAIADWLSIPAEPLINTALGDLPPVMATSPPRQRRWFKKAALLRPVLEQQGIIDTAHQLGYDKTHDLPE